MPNRQYRHRHPLKSKSSRPLLAVANETLSILQISKASVSTTEEKAFVIARLGTGETGSRLNRRRLNDVKTELGLGNSPKVIFAEGERVRGPGRIEFYLGSKLMSVSLLSRNGDFCSACCDRKKLFDKNRTVWRFYPPKHQ